MGSIFAQHGVRLNMALVVLGVIQASDWQSFQAKPPLLAQCVAASTINRFISPTAFPHPVNNACATIA